LYCLLEESPPLSTSALYDIDKNASLIAHQGRQPGLNLYSNQDKISRDEWADKIFIGINKCSSLLSIEHQNAVKAISLRVHNPDLTPSAIMLNEMQNQEKGFFEYTNQFSHKNKEHYKNLVVDKNYFDELNELSQSSQKKQKQIEASDQINFDQFLEKYMAYDD
jgi:glutamate--cysteine ligase